MIINSLIAGWDLVLGGLAANAAESINGDHRQTALSLHVVQEIEFSVAMALEALNLLRQCFFHHSREAEGLCVAILCSRQVAAVVASSRLDAYFIRDKARNFIQKLVHTDVII